MSVGDIHVDPARAFVVVDGVTYYRDGILYGSLLPEADYDEEHPMPTLWSLIVIKYRKKPVEVEAVQLNKDNAEEIAQWCGGMVTEEIDPQDDEKRYAAINIPTLEGTMRASEGDYVIKGTQGEFYPCKPGPFADTFEVV
jgi:hypothetical protein